MFPTTSYAGTGLLAGASQNAAKPQYLGGALHLAGLEARGAHVEALGGALHKRANTLNIRVPAAACTHVRVRDALPEARVLAADVTNRSHGVLLRLIMDPLAHLPLFGRYT